MIVRTASKGFIHPTPSEITSQSAYQSRREWMQRLALGAGGATLAAWAGRDALAQAATARPGKRSGQGDGKETLFALGNRGSAR